MDISSTTLSSLRSSASAVPWLTSRPPICSATTPPPPESWLVFHALPKKTTASVPKTAARKAFKFHNENCNGSLS